MTAFAGLGGALVSALSEVGPIPRTGRGVIRELGGGQATVRALSGLDHSPRRAEYADAREFEAARRRWRTAQRNVQRWAKGRTPSLRGDQRGRIELGMRHRRWSTMERRGGRGRVLLVIEDKPYPGKRQRARTRTRVMPAAQTAGQFVDADTMGAVLILAEQGEADMAAWTFIEALLAAYLDRDPDDLPDFHDVQWLKIWPEGTDEPA